ncbi:hypothetical protein LJC72_09145 [Bacteroides sp. OttesenSCG-928-D19]|nr:hypothetical protein [Bacteroides sp. OttesenSCG-928-N06]MDL2305486.1 hypothetical protein [Bacteroides sp. OttesenSCG-928-D19]
MKKLSRIVFSLLICFSFTSIATAQTDFEKYKQQQLSAFNQYVEQEVESFNAYRDSLNHSFATFLETAWKSFPLQAPEPLIKTPIRIPPVYDLAQEEPQPTEIPIEETLPVVVEPDPEPQPVEPSPALAPVPVFAVEYPVTVDFYGTAISLKETAKTTLPLSGVSEKEVASCWRMLSKLPHYEWEDEVMRIKAELKLNDWGVYQLLNRLYKVYFPQGNGNAQVVFSVFMLNQLGYYAKIGRAGNRLIPLVAFEQEVFNCPTFTYSNQASVKYAALVPMGENLTSVKTCDVDYANASGYMDLSMPTNPRFTVQEVAKELTPNNGKDTYRLRYNRNTVDFYTGYPCVHFTVYAKAALDDVLLESIKEQLEPAIAGKSQMDAVNWLLRFVQKSFEYKRDDEQFGYEKWFFAEETIASSYSDCEDRAILFAQLVHRLCKLPVVLVYYPGVHLATAVRFDNQQAAGSYVTVNGSRYLICDPTYTNANAGVAMPGLNEVEVMGIR